MKNLSYTNEFLKKLEPIIIKNDILTVQKIKDALDKIAQDDAVGTKLENIKTKKGDEVFMSEVELKKGSYSLFWTKKEGEKIIITLTKDTL